MKKAFFNKKILLSYFFLLIGCFFLFNSCGLEFIEIIDMPTKGNNPNRPEIIPDGVNPDAASSIFTFSTNETNASSYVSHFLGTAVVYKIYNDKEKLYEEVTDLENISNDIDENADIWDKKIENNFSFLRCLGNSEEHLIPAIGKNQEVEIRLADDISGSKDFEASIKIDGEYLLDSNNNKIIPLRRFDPVPINFNFFNHEKNPENSPLPNSSDSDVEFDSSSNNHGEWYVAMFAASVSQNVSFEKHYSNILYLGAVAISE